jgi:hypothetical protein
MRLLEAFANVQNELPVQIFVDYAKECAFTTFTFLEEPVDAVAPYPLGQNAPDCSSPFNNGYYHSSLRYFSNDALLCTEE